MKLMNREPTEEMIKAACAVKGMSLGSYREWWLEHFHAMYDAAPEIKVDMEPVKFSDHPDLVGGIKWADCELRWIDNRDRLWAEKVATLQAQLAERDKTILEQQARIDLLLDAISDFEVGRSNLALQKVKSHAYDLSALEAALKAERIKTLEDAAKLFDKYDSRKADQLRRMANELKEQL